MSQKGTEKIFFLYLASCIWVMLTAGCISSTVIQPLKIENIPIEHPIQYSKNDSLAVEVSVLEESFYSPPGLDSAVNESLNSKLLTELSNNMRFMKINPIVLGQSNSFFRESDFTVKVAISGKETKTEFWLSLFSFGLAPLVEFHHYTCKIAIFDKNRTKLAELVSESDTRVEIFGYQNQSTYNTYNKLYVDMIMPSIIGAFKFKDDLN